MRTAEEWDRRVSELNARHERMDRAELEAYCAHVRRLPALETEARVLAALILKPDKLATAVELETDDFVLFAHRSIFEAIRNVDARDEFVTVDAIFASLDAVDAQCKSLKAENCGGPLLELLANTRDYATQEEFEIDMQQLRNIRTARTLT